MAAAVSSAASGAAQGATVAGPWGAVAGGAIGLASSLFGGGKSKSQKRADRTSRSLSAQALPRDFTLTTTGGASAGFKQTEGDVERDAQGNALPGIKAPDGRELVVTPTGRLRYKGSGKRYRGSSITRQDGTTTRLANKGRFSGEFSLSQEGFTSEFSTDAGDLTDIRGGFRDAAQAALPRGIAPLDTSGVTQAADNANEQALAGIPQASSEELSANARAAEEAATGFLGKLDEDPLGGLFGGFEQAAQGALTDLEGGFASEEANRLALLRDRAAPQEARRFDRLQSKLFAQGRLDSTGGARQFQSLFEAEDAADLDRQLAAQDLGLKGREQSRSIASTTGAIANQVAGTRNAIDRDNLQAALAGFSQGGQLRGRAFDQDLAVGDRLRDAGADRFARAAEVLDIFKTERDRDFEVAKQGVGTVAGIDQSALNLFKAGQVGESARQSGVASSASLQPGAGPSPGNPIQAGATSFLEAGGGDAVGNFISGLFKTGGETPAPPPTNTTKGP